MRIMPILLKVVPQTLLLAVERANLLPTLDPRAVERADLLA